MHPHRNNNETDFAKAHPNYVKNEKKRKDPLPPTLPLEIEITFTDKALAAHNAKLVAQSKRLADRVRRAPVFFSEDGRGEKMLRRIEGKASRLRVA